MLKTSVLARFKKNLVQMVHGRPHQEPADLHLHALFSKEDIES